MDNTPRLDLPFLLPNQAQKHVTLNESLSALDTLVQLTVKTRSLSAEPTEPIEGEVYIVPEGATGSAWSGAPRLTVASFQDGHWRFQGPLRGWRAYDESTNKLLIYDGQDWGEIDGGEAEGAPLFGINATADMTNRLTVASEASLFNHAGAGHRLTVNKATLQDSASLIFQTGFNGQAEIGLTGDDDLHLRVNDGSTWRDGLVLNRQTGAGKFPSGLEHAESGAAVGQFIFTPGGDGVTSIYRINSTTTDLPRQAQLAGVNGDVLTLTTPVAQQFFSQQMRNVSWARIWNMSKSPAQSAWISWDLSATELQVIDASAIANWQAGETIQFGEPLSEFPMQVGAIDISPMMQNLFGRVFRQRGIVVRSELLDASAGDAIRLSVDGSPGAGVIGARCQSTGTPSSGDGVLLLATPVPSPVSSSNLILVMEQFASTARVRLFSSLALFG